MMAIEAILLGTDLVSIDRVRRLLESTAHAREKVFAPAEVAYCESKGRLRWRHYAARFAAKEAVLKALGTGWRGALELRDIATVPGPLGRPVLRFAAALGTALRGAGIGGGEVSLTHDDTHAWATVILTKLARPEVDHGTV
ncbi:MAG TPA: holo-ACP synthase [Candidatus Binatia bacterium]|jgi:holo-[acyl-carrier protein] synthase|nr:holo-ACP synthase [Candidatus Binatia bacterium]